MAQSTQRHQGSKKSTQQTTGLAGLLQAVRDAVDAFKALKSINCRFDDREQSGMANLVRFAKQHASAVVNGGKPESDKVERTTRLANNLAGTFGTRFDAIMHDSFIHFDKAMEPLRTSAPEILVRDGDKIADLQAALRKEIGRNDATFDDTIDAYKAMMEYVRSVSSEAENALEAVRQAQRHERAVTTSQEILDELSALDLD